MPSDNHQLVRDWMCRSVKMLLGLSRSRHMNYTVAVGLRGGGLPLIL